MRRDWRENLGSFTSRQSDLGEPPSTCPWSVLPCNGDPGAESSSVRGRARDWQQRLFSESWMGVVWSQHGPAVFSRLWPLPSDLEQAVLPVCASAFTSVRK